MKRAEENVGGELRSHLAGHQRDGKPGEVYCHSVQDVGWCMSTRGTSVWRERCHRGQDL